MVKFSIKLTVCDITDDKSSRIRVGSMRLVQPPQVDSRVRDACFIVVALRIAIRENIIGEGGEDDLNEAEERDDLSEIRLTI